VSKQRREFASFVKTRSQKPGNLLDKRLGSQKCIVLLGELLDKFLLLVQLFQVVGAHVGNTRFLSLITMLLITKDADGEFRPWDMAQSTGKKLLQPKNLTTLKLLIKATTWSRVDKKINYESCFQESKVLQRGFFLVKIVLRTQVRVILTPMEINIFRMLFSIKNL
jgi:hypothetical protein